MNIFPAMLAAHMVGDYIAQTNWMATNKFTSTKAWLIHVLCYTACFIPAAAMSSWWLLPMIGIPHAIVDWRRWASAEPWPPKPILVDQSIHAACIAAAYYAVGLI